MKRTIRLTLLILAAMTVGACGDYRATTVDREAIENVIGRFKSGVEQYDILKMTESLSSDFVLTLQEGSLRYEKTRAVLLEELEADEENQISWRTDYGYRLELVLTGGAPSFADLYAAVHNGFTVIESADGIGPITTDTGTIDWRFVKMGDYWRVVTMTITFDAAASVSSSTRSFSIPGGNPFFRRSSRP